MTTPRIAEIRCERLQFQPGDRILVRTPHRLETEAKKKLTQGIQKWAGVEVEVLIICIKDFHLTVEKL